MHESLDAYRLLIADVYELAGLSRHTSEDLARASGQTAARWHVLSVLSDEPRTVPWAARRLGLAPQSVQRVVNDLLADGQVESRTNPDHARSSLIALTDRGRATLGELFARSDRDRAEVLRRAGLDATDLRQTGEVVRALVRALREREGWVQD